MLKGLPEGSPFVVSERRNNNRIAFIKRMFTNIVNVWLLYIVSFIILSYRFNLLRFSPIQYILNKPNLKKIRKRLPKLNFT